MDNENKMISEEELDKQVELFDPIIEFVRENYPEGYVIIDKNYARVYNNPIINVPSKKDIEFIKRYAMIMNGKTNEFYEKTNTAFGKLQNALEEFSDEFNVFKNDKKE